MKLARAQAPWSAEIKKKFKSFGYKTFQINGHSFKDLDRVFKKIRKKKNSPPTVVIANTIKGKGISFMEKNVKWHHAVPQKDEFEKALKELS